VDWKYIKIEKINGVRKIIPAMIKKNSKEKESSKEKENNINININNVAVSSGKKDRYNKDSTQLLLAQYLYACIKVNCPKFKTQPDAKMQKEAHAINLMMERDSRTPEEIEDVITWCQDNDFWQSNILCVGKLRKQFDKLFMQMQQENTPENAAELTNYAASGMSIQERHTAEVLMDAYVNKFSADAFSISSKSASRRQIYTAAVRLQKMLDKLEGTKFNSKKMADLLVRCLDKEYAQNGKNVYPGMLCSDNTWEVLFPQYIRRELPSLAARLNGKQKSSSKR